MAQIFSTVILALPLIQEGQGYRYDKLRKAFSKFYHRHYELISKYHTGLETPLLHGLSEPEFDGYVYIVYTFHHENMPI